jgi:hypothetical protein
MVPLVSVATIQKPLEREPMFYRLCSVLFVALTFFHADRLQGDIISSFNFDELAIGVNNSPTPTMGMGTATVLGMTNNFTSPPSLAAADILTDANGANTTNRSWRIRGGGTGSGNGWAASAPQYSQGAQFDMSTLGFENIVLTYDWKSTTQGVKHQQVQYTTDGSSWFNAGDVLAGPSSEAWVNGITVDFSSIAGVNNNPLFGVRIVSAYAPDGPNAGQYVNLAGLPINSTSGNWRLDSVTISGNAIPEPSVTLLGLVGLGFSLMSRRRR